jgi:hypothetical protein
MAAPPKYPDELRDRATRLVVEARRDRRRLPGRSNGSPTRSVCTPRRCGRG